MYLLCIAGLSGLLVVGAIIDIESRRLPNWLTASIAALYGLYVIVSPVPVDWLTAFLVGGIVFVLGFACFAFNLMGGGDVKLMAGLALWAGVDHIAAFLLITALAGGVLSIITLISQRLGTFPLGMLTTPLHNLAAKVFPMPAGSEGKFPASSSSAAEHQDSLPYGVAIAAGGFTVIIALLQT